MFSLVRTLLKKKTFLLRAEGDSMVPMLMSGDSVEYERCSFSKLRVHDIILFKKNKELIAHRIIFKTQTYVITRGDSNTKADGKILRRYIIGRAIKIKRRDSTTPIENVYKAQSNIFLNEIILVKKALDKGKTQFAVMNGLPVNLYYENKHLKRISDEIDLLISGESMEKCSNTLLKLGYLRQPSSLFGIHPNHKRIFAKEIGTGKIIVNLNTQPQFLMNRLTVINNIYPQSKLIQFSKKMLVETEQIYFHKEKIQILSPDYMFIYLSLMFFHNNFQGIFRLELLREIVKKARFSKKKQMEIASTIIDYRLERYIYPVFVQLLRFFPDIKNYIHIIQDRIKQNNMHHLLVGKLFPSIFNNEPQIQASVRRLILILIV